MQIVSNHNLLIVTLIASIVILELQFGIDMHCRDSDNLHAIAKFQNVGLAHIVEWQEFFV